MIIPTLRVSQQDVYNKMVEVYLQNGIKTIRVNMTRHSMERYCSDIEYINSISNNQFEIMADIPLPGRKYRLDLQHEEELQICKGQTVYFYPKKSTTVQKGITVNTDSFWKVMQGEKIIIGDGELSLVVEMANKDKIIAIADNDSIVRGQRSFIISGSLSYERYKEEQLYKYIEAFKRIKPSIVVLSFSEQIEDLLKIESEIKSKIGDVTIVPKLETPLGTSNCDKICQKYKSIMLGRGDLALFSEIKHFAENQDIILKVAKENKTRVIVATDILITLYNSRVPSRGDLTDIFYLKHMGVNDIVASAGISMKSELFEQFCFYAEDFRVTNSFSLHL